MNIKFFLCKNGEIHVDVLATTTSVAGNISMGRGWSEVKQGIAHNG